MEKCIENTRQERTKYLNTLATENRGQWFVLRMYYPASSSSSSICQARTIEIIWKDIKKHKITNIREKQKGQVWSRIHHFSSFKCLVGHVGYLCHSVDVWHLFRACLHLWRLDGLVIYLILHVIFDQKFTNNKMGQTSVLPSTCEHRQANRPSHPNLYKSSFAKILEPRKSSFL